MKTTPQNTPNSNLKPYKEKEFELYALWKALPPIFKNRPDNIKEAMGLTEEGYINELLAIKTQKEFAEKYNLEPRTLVQWNKYLETNPPTFQEVKKIYRQFTKNVIGALYRKALAKGDAPEVKLWFQAIEEWAEKDMHINLNLEAQIKAEEDLTKIAESLK